MWASLRYLGRTILMPVLTTIEFRSVRDKVSQELAFVTCPMEQALGSLHEFVGVGTVHRHSRIDGNSPIHSVFANGKRQSADQCQNALPPEDPMDTIYRWKLEVFAPIPHPALP